MAKRKSGKTRKAAKSKTRGKSQKRSKKAARKRPAARKRSAAGPARRKPAKRPSGPPPIRPGMITHTELASANPPATKAWCETVLGWKFEMTVPTPTGPYHMWRFSNDTGGGIRANNPPEVPGSIPYCEVVDIRAAFAKALEAGAREMVPPMQLPGSMGWIAIVAAPGGVAIGFWSTK